MPTALNPNMYLTPPEDSVYEIIRTIDKKLDNLADDILSRNSKHIDYICRMDEIRGLIMDMLL